MVVNRQKSDNGRPGRVILIREYRDRAKRYVVYHEIPVLLLLAIIRPGNPGTIDALSEHAVTS